VNGFHFYLSVVLVVRIGSECEEPRASRQRADRQLMSGAISTVRPWQILTSRGFMAIGKAIMLASVRSTCWP
jgi:hypothetical protein